MTGKDIVRARILVVDQEDWCREFLASVFKLCGFEEFKMATSVDEALEALEDGPFDLIITDVKMPNYQRLLENSRIRYPSMRYILMIQQRSATHHLVYLEQAEVVYKPLCLDEIIRKIRDAIHQKHLRQAEEEFRRLKQEAYRILR